MAGNQFGGSGPGGADRFGYYANPGGSRPGGSTGGSAPGAVATNPFGGAAANTFGTPYQQTAAPAPRSNAPWVALLVVLVVLIAAVGGAWWWRQRSRLVLPEQLGGMDRNTSSPYSKVMESAMAQASDRAGGDNKVAGALYGLDPREQTVLLVARGPNMTAVQPEVAAKAGLKAYGPDLCQASGKLVTCIRMHGDLAVIVLAQRTGPPVPPAVVAGWADEAWALQ